MLKCGKPAGGKMGGKWCFSSVKMGFKGQRELLTTLLELSTWVHGVHINEWAQKNDECKTSPYPY